MRKAVTIPLSRFMTVLGGKPPATVTINELTTVASVWTHDQFLDGTAIKGPALGLRIAAGNVPNFVDLRREARALQFPKPLNGSSDANDRQFRNPGQCDCRMRYARERQMRAPNSTPRPHHQRGTPRMTR